MPSRRFKAHAHLLPYQEERIAFAKAKAEARRIHPQPCDCPYCITRERQQELFQANLARNPSATEEVPF